MERRDDSDLCWMVYADWCDENDREQQAADIRQDVELGGSNQWYWEYRRPGGVGGLGVGGIGGIGVGGVGGLGLDVGVGSLGLGVGIGSLGIGVGGVGGIGVGVGGVSFGDD